jgi:hypothetical protein
MYSICLAAAACVHARRDGAQGLTLYKQGTWERVLLVASSATEASTGLIVGYVQGWFNPLGEPDARLERQSLRLKSASMNTVFSC